jgi:putative ABC transport system substrate-binding protein
MLSGFAEDRLVESELLRTLSQLGWDNGRNVQIDLRWGAGNIDRIKMMAKELVASQREIIITVGTPATVAVQRETRTIPIIFLIVADPVGAGIVDNLARPGGNTSGLGNPEGTFGGKLLTLLKRIAPRMRRAAAMFNPDTAPSRGLYYLGSFEAAARSLAIEPLIAEVRNDGDIERVITTLGQEEAGLVALPDNFMFTHRGTVIGLSIRNNVPTIYDSVDFAKEGGLLQYGASFPDMYRRVPSYVDRILRGAKPGDLPVELPTKYEFVINLKTAQAIGLDVSPDLISIADAVIE